MIFFSNDLPKLCFDESSNFEKKGDMILYTKYRTSFAKWSLELSVLKFISILLKAISYKSDLANP